MGADIFHADGRTERQADRQKERKTYRHDDANSCYRNFVNVPKNSNNGNRPTISATVQFSDLKKQTTQ
jgi:hypothetical protein